MPEQSCIATVPSEMELGGCTCRDGPLRIAVDGTRQLVSLRPPSGATRAASINREKQLLSRVDVGLCAAVPEDVPDNPVAPGEPFAPWFQAVTCFDNATAWLPLSVEDSRELSRALLTLASGLDNGADAEAVHAAAQVLTDAVGSAGSCVSRVAILLVTGRSSCEDMVTLQLGPDDLSGTSLALLIGQPCAVCSATSSPSPLTAPVGV